MDERPDRTVEHLSAAEHAQRNILTRGDAIDSAQMELARKKRSQAQASREVSARAYLRDGMNFFPFSFLPPPPPIFFEFFFYILGEGGGNTKFT